MKQALFALAMVAAVAIVLAVTFAPIAGKRDPSPETAGNSPAMD